MGERVCVRWLDAAFELDDPDVQPLVLNTVGVVVRDEDTYVSVAQEWSDDLTLLRGVTAIPRAVILSVEPLP